MAVNQLLAGENQKMDRQAAQQGNRAIDVPLESVLSLGGAATEVDGIRKPDPSVPLPLWES